MFLADYTPTYEFKSCKYFMFTYNQGVSEYPELLKQINNLSHNVVNIIKDFNYSNKYIVVAFKNTDCNINTIHDKKIIGFLVCLSPVYSNGEKCLEVIKTYGESDIKISLLLYYLKQTEPCYKIFVYSSNVDFLHSLYNLKYRCPKITTSTVSGLKFFKPTIRLGRYCVNEPAPVTEHTQLNEIDYAIGVLNRYYSYKMYTLNILLTKKTLDLLEKEILYPEIYNGVEIETGGRLRIKYDNTQQQLVAHLPIERECKGNYNEIYIKEYPIGYHIHPAKHINTTGDYNFLMAWPSGGDYSVEFFNRFYYDTIGRYLSLVISKCAIYSINLTPMCVYVINEYILPNKDGDMLITLISVVIKYYFKLVEDLRYVHKHSYGKHTKHIITPLRTATGDISKWLCSSFTCEKLLELLETTNAELQIFFITQFNITTKLAINKQEYNRLTSALKSLLHIYNFPFFDTKYIQWININRNMKIPIYLELIITQQEYNNIQQLLNNKHKCIICNKDNCSCIDCDCVECQHNKKNILPATYKPIVFNKLYSMSSKVI